MYALEDLGWTDQLTTQFEPYAAAGLAPARVAVQHRGAYVLYSQLGELRATVAGRLEHEAAGDLTLFMGVPETDPMSFVVNCPAPVLAVNDYDPADFATEATPAS